MVLDEFILDKEYNLAYVITVNSTVKMTPAGVQVIGAPASAQKM